MRTFSLSQSFIEHEEKTPKILWWWTASTLAVGIISIFAFDEHPMKVIVPALVALPLGLIAHAKFKRDIARYKSGWHDVSIGEQSVILPGTVEVPVAMITSIRGDNPTTEHPFGMIVVEYDTGKKWAGIVRRTRCAWIRSDQYDDFASIWDAFENVGTIAPLYR